jgi:hypothetical protein
MAKSKSTKSLKAKTIRRAAKPKPAPLLDKDHIVVRLSELGDLCFAMAQAHEHHPDHKQLAGAFWALGKAIEGQAEVLDQLRLGAEAAS